MKPDYQHDDHGFPLLRWGMAVPKDLEVEAAGQKATSPLLTPHAGEPVRPGAADFQPKSRTIVSFSFTWKNRFQFSSVVTKSLSPTAALGLCTLIGGVPGCSDCAVALT